MPSLRFFLLPALLVTTTTAACVPMRASTPERTWRAEDPEPKCIQEALLDPSTGHWTRSGRAALETKLDRREPAVVSALGCHVDVLAGCSAPSSKYRRTNEFLELEGAKVTAKGLSGECAGATHVVRGASLDGASVKRVELAPISLDGYALTGVWQGAMRQPGGPYEVYDVTMQLEQHGDRVKGITHLSTIDNAYWGDLRFEGRLEGTTLYFADAEIIDDNLGIFLAWCLKSGYLLVDQKSDRMRGPWKAGICAPGAVDVKWIGEDRSALSKMHRAALERIDERASARDVAAR